jgi:DNA adenine methylase
MNKQTLHPFLKWAGGKRWLIPHLETFIPKSFNTYIEPFLGSGAVFFSLKPEKSILSDINSDLIETYKAIKKDWQKVVHFLNIHSIDHCKEYYYKIRATEYSDTYERAAKFIYLNRTCWNGLYRVNLNGVFNVPKGTKDKVLLDTDNFDKISQILANTELLEIDFESILNKSKEGDFLFIDPPYTVAHNQNEFIKYNQTLFKWEDQIRLRDCLLEARNRGAHFLATNACHKAIIDLYKDFDFSIATRNSIIAANPLNRTSRQELIITG